MTCIGPSVNSPVFHVSISNYLSISCPTEKVFAPVVVLQNSADCFKASLDSAVFVSRCTYGSLRTIALAPVCLQELTAV